MASLWSRMSTPSHTDDIDYAYASTSTISDGRTKHRAVGADDDDAPFVGAGSELEDAAATSNGSSSGGKRKQATFDVAATASTFSAFPTIQSLNAEKAKLDAEKKKLEDKLEAGVSDASERAAIRADITAIRADITAIRQQITGIDARVTASISAAPPTSIAPALVFSEPVAVRAAVLSALKSANVPIKPPAQRGRYSDGERFANWAFSATHERGGALAAAVEYINNGNMVVNGRPGYAATWGAPGTGKSHLLDAIVAAFAEHEHVLVIPVTFNDPTRGSELGVRGLAVRLLFSYFVGPRDHAKRDPSGEAHRAAGMQFARAVDVLGPLFAVGDANLLRRQVAWCWNAIVHDFCEVRGVQSFVAALLIDEIRFSGEEVAVYNAANHLLSASSVASRVIYTALDLNSVIDPSRLGSSRPITWLPLPHLSWKPDAAHDDMKERFLALAGGHPRTMQFVVSVCESMKHGDTASDYFTRVAQMLGAGVLTGSQKAFLAPALIGLVLEPNETFGKAKFVDAIAAGALMNSIETSSAYNSQVPRLSLFLLYMAQNRMMEKLVALLFADDLTSEQFERLHAYWDTVLRSLYFKHRVELQCDGTMALMTALRVGLHSAPTIGSLALYRDVTMLHGSCVRVQTVDAPDVLFLNEKLSDVDRCEWSMAGSGKQVVKLDVGQMTVPAKGNTAFDLATLFTTDTGEPHLLLIECKFSAADASTVLGWPNDLENRFANLKRDLPLMFANPDHLFTRSGIKSARQVTYLVVPMRAITSTLCEQATTWCDAELAKEVAAAGAAGATAAAATAEAANKMFNAAILERDDLLRLYGPTLQDAVAFAYK